MIKKLFSALCLTVFMDGQVMGDVPELSIQFNNEDGRKAISQLPGKYSYSFSDNYVEAANSVPYRYCELHLKTDFKAAPNKVLTFEYKNVYSPKDKVAYAGVYFTDSSKKAYFAPIPLSSEWKKARISFATLSDNDKIVIPKDTSIILLDFYSRINDADPEGMVKIQVRNIEVATDTNYDPQASERIHFTKEFINANPAKFNYIYADGYVEIANLTPDRVCELSIKSNLVAATNMILSFDYQNICTPEDNVDNTALYIVDTRRKVYYVTFPVSTEWKTVTVPFDTLNSLDKKPLASGTMFYWINIYSRISDKNPAAKVKLRIRNLQIIHK